MEQTSLFETEVVPDGLRFDPEFLDATEEWKLIQFIGRLPFAQFKMHGVVAKRRVVHFGMRYLYGSRRLNPTEDMPPELQPFRARAADMLEIPGDEFAEALVTEYKPGAGIGWHHDSPPFGIIAGISLGSSCRMRFQRGTGNERETTAIELPPRSIYVLTGCARNEWQHSIPAMTKLRYSITFRTLKANAAAVVAR